MKYFVFMIALMFVLSACGTNDAEAIKALDDNGFKDISITDRGFAFANYYGCDTKDGNWYHANATNANGKQVSMLVCCGAAVSFKGCTVRSK